MRFEENFHKQNYLKVCQKHVQKQSFNENLSH